METASQDPFESQTLQLIGVTAFGLETKLVVDRKNKAVTITAPGISIQYDCSFSPNNIAHAEILRHNHEGLYWHLATAPLKQGGIIQDVAHSIEHITEKTLPPSYFRLESALSLLMLKTKMHATLNYRDIQKQQHAINALQYALEYGEMFLKAFAKQSNDAEVSNRYDAARKYAVQCWKQVFPLNQEALHRLDVAKRRVQYALI